jgi:hypothetical protein
VKKDSSSDLFQLQHLKGIQVKWNKKVLNILCQTAQDNEFVGLWKSQVTKIAVALQHDFLPSILDKITSWLFAQLLVVEKILPALLDDLVTLTIV